MIVALLVLIVFILLFGAGVVTGWLANIFGYVLGFVVFVGLALWVGSFFGENGFIYVVFGFLAFVFVFGMWAKSTED